MNRSQKNRIQAKKTSNVHMTWPNELYVASTLFLLGESSLPTLQDRARTGRIPETRRQADQALPGGSSAASQRVSDRISRSHSSHPRRRGTFPTIRLYWAVARERLDGTRSRLRRCVVASAHLRLTAGSRPRQPGLARNACQRSSSLRRPGMLQARRAGRGEVEDTRAGSAREAQPGLFQELLPHVEVGPDRPRRCPPPEREGLVGRQGMADGG